MSRREKYANELDRQLLPIIEYLFVTAIRRRALEASPDQPGFRPYVFAQFEKGNFTFIPQKVTRKNEMPVIKAYWKGYLIWQSTGELRQGEAELLGPLLTDKLFWGPWIDDFYITFQAEIATMQYEKAKEALSALEKRANALGPLVPYHG